MEKMLTLSEPPSIALAWTGAKNFVAHEIENCRKYTCGWGYNRTMQGIPTIEWVDWKERKPTKMLGLNRDELRHLINQKWTGRELRAYKAVRAQGPVKLPEDMEMIRGASITSVEYALEKDWPVLKTIT